VARSSAGPGRGSEGRGGGERNAAPGELAGRVPPQDIEVERAVLSALLRDNRAIHSVLTEVVQEDFYHPAHQQLYQSMLALQDQNEPVDLHTLANHLNERKLLDSVGGPVYLAELWDYEVTAANVLQHARIVRDKSVRRHLIAVATEIAEMGYEQSEDAGELLDRAESRVFEIGQARSRQSFRSLHDEMDDAIDYVEALMERRGELTGCPTGYKDFDEKTGGLQPGELVIIAARPSMGKTALALNMARNAAVDHHKKVAIFSLEMTKRALALRLLSSEARVDLSSFRRGFGSRADYERLVQVAGTLAESIAALNEVKDRGMARHIGVSNFTVPLIEQAVALSRHPLVCNQIENHPYLNQDRVIAACRRHGLAVVSYCPLARGSALFAEPAVTGAAARLGRSPAQVVLRWHVHQEGVAAIPRSSDAGRIAQNLDVFDFALKPAEMAAISALRAKHSRICDFEFSPDWDPV
jgi:diketogulonate reductase-like aldo/keto reductase